MNILHPHVATIHVLYIVHTARAEPTISYHCSFTDQHWCSFIKHVIKNVRKSLVCSCLMTWVLMFKSGRFWVGFPWYPTWFLPDLFERVPRIVEDIRPLTDIRYFSYNLIISSPWLSGRKLRNGQLDHCCVWFDSKSQHTCFSNTTSIKSVLYEWSHKRDSTNR